MFPLNLKFPDALFERLPKGWLTKNEAVLLWNSAVATEGPMLEIGCYHGRSTVLLASLQRKLFCVDPFSGFDSDDLSGETTRKAFLENTRELEIITLFPCKIEDWRPNGLKVGFAYLDGDHTFQGTITQIETARECKADILCLHDYAETGGGKEIVKAVEFCDLVVLKRKERIVRCTFK